MVYCLYGDSHSMDDKLKEILRKLQLYDPAYFPHDRPEDARPHRLKPKKEQTQQPQRRMDEEAAHGITHKMARIDINKDDKEAEKVLQVAVGTRAATKEQKSIVYRAITELKNKNRNEAGSISFSELRNYIPSAALNDDQMLAALLELDSDGRIHYEPKEEKIYL